MKKLCMLLCILMLLSGCSIEIQKSAASVQTATVEPQTFMSASVPTPASIPVSPIPVSLSVTLQVTETATPLCTPSPSPVPSYTVGGQTVRADAERLTLSSAAELELLSFFPFLNSADCSAFILDPHTAYKIKSEHPYTDFVFSLEAFGITVTKETECLDLRGMKNLTLKEVEETVECMPSIRKVDMCGCGFSDEEMGDLFDRYPEVRFVWELNLRGRKLRTDAIGFSTLNPGKYTNEKSSESYKRAVKAANSKRLYTEDIQVLRYCPDLVALDLGHNYIDNLSVLQYLPKLQILIVADNKITDISVFAQLPELVYVEFFMNAVTDISPLANHEHLLDLNFCNNKVSDISPLLTMPNLERAWCAGNKFSRNEGKAMQEQMPGCIVDYTARDDTADGWREHERYEWMRAYVKGEHNPA